MTLYVSAPGARRGGIERMRARRYAPRPRRGVRRAVGALLRHRGRMGYSYFGDYSPYGTLATRLVGRAYRR